MAQFSMEIMRLTGSVPRENQHFGIYPLNSCIYYKFPDEVEEQTGWKEDPPRSTNGPLVDSTPLYP